MTPHEKIGRFKVIRELGRGSQGVVYLASDPHLERQVAIKTLHAPFSQNNTRQKRLMKEARTVSKLQHPNIIPLFEADEHNGRMYLVFEFVKGIALRDLIHQEGAFVVHRAVTFMMQILDGISEAHKQGVIHRDLSPSNILIDSNTMPRIMDFGISVIAGSGKTQEKEIAGTPYYMSPEHFSKKPLSARSDIFSLGLIFYEMVTGKPSITAENDFAVMYKIANDKIDPPSLKNEIIDKKLDMIILKALEKDESRRYSNASEMRTELKAYLEDHRDANQEESDSTEQHSTLDFLLRKIRYNSDFPTFSRNIMEINKKASVSGMNYSSASELANTVLKDYSLTNKLLKLVNSAFYGQFAGKITTISRAVVVLGFEQVRMAASSLMLFDQLKNKGQKEELKEAAVGSFMSGMISKDLADRLRINDNEEVFICSMLYNLGRYLVLFYFGEEHKQIKKLMAQKGINEQAAAKAILGISYEDLGMGIAKSWKFPDKIIRSMKRLPKGKIDAPKSEEEMINNLAGFSNDLCSIIHNNDEEGSGQALNGLLKRFEKSIPVSAKNISKLLDSAMEKVDEYSEIFNVNFKKSNFFKEVKSLNLDEDQRIQEKIEEDDTIEYVQEMTPEKFEDVEIHEVSPDPDDTVSTQSILIHGIQDITNTLLEEFALNDVLTMILETMYRGFRFKRVLFCIANSKTSEVSARFGFGKDVDRMITEFHFKISNEPNVFNFAMLQGKDVGIDNAKDMKFKKRIPAWYFRSVSASAFVLYPVVVNKKAIGLIYADKARTGKVIKTSHINFMKTLCNQAVLAIKQMR
ncbi:MAG: HDOD domain-containing protein [Deltaproteobacteria bacterium]|nr:HDOD domain-containing protein [Deltaproteobacteria bacterium]MBW1914718.1 HDOD domain-containing protein [Deltaproteobacteria bacterium]